MTHARTRFPIICLSIALLATSPAGAQGPTLRDQIGQHEHALAEARSGQRPRDEEIELTTLGGLYRQAGDVQKALDDCNQALAIDRRLGNRGREAAAENTIGRIYTDLGQEQKALDIFNQILPVWRELHIRPGEASTLNNMGRVYNDLGQRQKALESLNQALPMWREVGNREGEASTLDNLGSAYAAMGEGRESLDYFNQALRIWRDSGNRNGEALTLNNMARAYSDLGQKQKSLEAYQQALTIWRAQGNRQGEASTLNLFGEVYRELGQSQMSLDYLNQALPIWREVGNRSGEARALNDIGRTYMETGQATKALDCFKQALPIWRESGNRRGEASTLNNLGRAYFTLGQLDKAIDFDLQALAIWREVEDRRGQALALSGVGWVYAVEKQPEKALSNRLAALSLAREAADPDLEGGIDTSLMIGFRNQHRPEEAILFGTDAVNSYQQIRKNISDLDKDLQNQFAQSKSATYRILAELLVETDRLAEAEHVLDLLKEQELKEVVRGAAENAETRSEPLKLTGAQQEAESKLSVPMQTAASLASVSAEYAVLLAKPTRTPDEAAHMKSLEAEIEAGNQEVSDFFRKTLYPALAQKSGTQQANARLNEEKAEVSRLQNTLLELGPRVIGIRLLLGDEHGYAIVVTAQARKKFELTATPEELRSKVLQVREDLRRPASDPKPHLAELYAMAVAPYAVELAALERSPHENGSVPAILWSLDGVMRYVPMAALYDGQHYLLERFNNILFTPESYGHMGVSSANKGPFRALAMGLSKSYGGLPALPGVKPELNAVARDPAVPESHGPIDGVLLSDEQFTFAALKAQLGARSSFPVVHIASHFVLEAEGGSEPYLMLGGETSGEPQGYLLTLSKLEDSPITFRGTRLLTLSACSTAKGDVAKDGLEMDSLGMIAQQKDAEAVLATLWDVNDASTSRIMSDFYTRWVTHPVEGKGEALRVAQLAFLRGTNDTQHAGSNRGLQAVETVPAATGARYSHPFFWAPFVLFGNYQ